MSKAGPSLKSPAENLAPGKALTIANVADGAEALIVSDLARAVTAKHKLGPVSLALVCRDGQRMAQIARAAGADAVILYREADFEAEVRRLTDGQVVDVVYDSVGKDTYMGSLDCLRPIGLFVIFGQSSGAIPPFSTALLSQKGSLFMTRPTLFTYVAKRSDLENSAAALFDVVASGAVKIEINQTYALKDAGQAQTDLENRATTGTTVLLP